MPFLMCLIDGSKRIENQGQEEKHQGLGAPHLKQLRFEAKQTHPHELHFQSPGSILPPAAGDSRWPAPGAGLAAGSVSKSIMILCTIFSSVLDRVSCGLTILRWSRRSRRPLSCFTSTPVLGAASSASQLSTTICVSQGVNSAEEIYRTLPQICTAPCMRSVSRVRPIPVGHERL